MGHSNESLQRWTAFVGSDEARNRFIVPSLNFFIRTIRPRSIIDVGPRASYIFDGIHETQHVWDHYIAIEADPSAADYLRIHVGRHEQANVFSGTFREWPRRTSGTTLVLMFYTLLEWDAEERLSNLKLLEEGDWLLLALPDVWEDVPLLRFESFRQGQSVRLSKPGHEVSNPFIATRLEVILEEVCGLGMQLTAVRSFWTIDRKLHYMLLLRRTVQ